MSSPTHLRCSYCYDPFQRDVRPPICLNSPYGFCRVLDPALPHVQRPCLSSSGAKTWRSSTPATTASAAHRRPPAQEQERLTRPLAPPLGRGGPPVWAMEVLGAGGGGVGRCGEVGWRRRPRQAELGPRTACKSL